MLLGGLLWEGKKREEQVGTEYGVIRQKRVLSMGEGETAAGEIVMQKVGTAVFPLSPGGCSR